MPILIRVAILLFSAPERAAIAITAPSLRVVQVLTTNAPVGEAQLIHHRRVPVAEVIAQRQAVALVRTEAVVTEVVAAVQKEVTLPVLAEAAVFHQAVVEAAVTHQDLAAVAVVAIPLAEVAGLEAHDSNNLAPF